MVRGKENYGVQNSVTQTIEIYFSLKDGLEGIVNNYIIYVWIFIIIVLMYVYTI